MRSVGRRQEKWPIGFLYLRDLLVKDMAAQESEGQQCCDETADYDDELTKYPNYANKIIDGIKL